MRFVTLVSCLMMTAGAFGQLPAERPLYPEGLKSNPVEHPEREMYVDSAVSANALSALNRVYSYVSEPTFQLYPAKATVNRRVGLVIFPGGGFKNIWLDKEGSDIALWLSERGVTCMVVKYRTNRKDQEGNWLIDFDAYKGALYEDARTSMQLLKRMADSLGFDRDKVGMMGFSAGGWLAERMVYKYYENVYEWNPAFVALIYHGNYVQLINRAKNKEKLPPFFMAVAQDDEKLPFHKVRPYLQKVSAQVKQSELHVYPVGGHGFGLAGDESLAVSAWKVAFLDWIDRLFRLN